MLINLHIFAPKPARLHEAMSQALKCARHGCSKSPWNGKSGEFCISTLLNVCNWDLVCSVVGHDLRQQKLPQHATSSHQCFFRRQDQNSCRGPKRIRRLEHISLDHVGLPMASHSFLHPNEGGLYTLNMAVCTRLIGSMCTVNSSI